MRILLLGGTTEASQMARALHNAGLDAVFSYAGRTQAPISQPLQTRIGGFGGVLGLVTYLHENAITHIIDATHPFAKQMSENAFRASIETKTPLLNLERAPWRAVSGDIWTHVDTIEAAVDQLPEGAHVFLAIGKQNLAPFSGKRNHYLLRLVDPPQTLPLPECEAVISRGPFTVANDTQLLTAHRITHIVAKNSGGMGAEAKLIAARALQIPVILIERPTLPNRAQVSDVQGAMEWLHQARLGV
jgi:precorrin-6A/cobalt-precorrin-6A reductase